MERISIRYVLIPLASASLDCAPVHADGSAKWITITQIVTHIDGLLPAVRAAGRARELHSRLKICITAELASLVAMTCLT
ncbi:hypothetical protein BDW68DRAFT_171686 [Aspergillus falconensis]